MLELSQADVSYGKARALHGVSVTVTQSQIVALVGRNGAGKSTALKALMGQMSLHGGRRLLNGQDVSALSLDELSRRGIALVPEDRQIFSGLSCEENLEIAALSHPAGHWTRETVYTLFPRLRERSRAQGTSLSGGEQQMLAIGRALMTNPRYLLLDEPTEGLAPVIVDQIVEAIAEISRAGVAVALVEQNFHIPRRLAHEFVLMDSGRVAWTGCREEISDELEALLAGFSTDNR